MVRVFRNVHIRPWTPRTRATRTPAVLATDLEADHPDLVECLEADGEETLPCFHFPAEHRRRIRTTNGLERVNQELKRRTRVVRIFPNPRSVLRLATALLKEYHEDWITGRRYLRMEPLLRRRRTKEEEIRTAA